MNYFTFFFQVCVCSYIQYVYFETYREHHHVEMKVITTYVIGSILFCMMLLFLPQAYFFLVYITLLVVLSFVTYYKKENHIESLRSYFIILLSAFLVVYAIRYVVSVAPFTGVAFKWDIDNVFCSFLFIIMILFLRVKRGLTSYPYITIILGATSILIIIDVIYGDKIQFLTNVLLLCLLALFRMFYCMEKSKDNVLDLTIQRYAEKGNKEKYEATEKENKRIMQQLHDMKKHLQILDGMASHQEEYISYKREIENKVEDIAYYKQSKNILIDHILQTYRLKFQNANIQCNVEVDEIDFSFMDVIHLSAMLANLLDNAIESCLKCEERFILLKIKQQQNLVIIKMKNSCVKVYEEDGQLKTTKSDHLYHGYGMQNIAMMAAKYGGSLNYRYNEEHHVFTTSVVLCPNR